MLIVWILVLLFVSSSESVHGSHGNITNCFHRLITEQYNNSYNYLQLSINVGGDDAFPGFASFYVYLSDESVEKAHDLAKFSALRRFQLPALIDVKGRGIKISSNIRQIKTIPSSLIEARRQNEAALTIVHQCHERAVEVNDGHVQNFLESNFFDHHIKLEKRFSDYLNRLNEKKIDEQTILIEMLDNELLKTHGDLRADLFK